MKKRIIKLVRNKYVLASTIFLLWICLFNDIDLFYIMQCRTEVRSMESEISELSEKNEQATRQLAELNSNKQSLEKFARETYYMKRDNEDVYVFKERAD